MEVLQIARKRIGIIDEEELEYLVMERLPKLFVNRDDIDLGPVIITRELREEGEFYRFRFNSEALSKIAEFEDQLLEEAEECCACCGLPLN